MTICTYRPTTLPETRSPTWMAAWPRGRGLPTDLRRSQLNHVNLAEILRRRPEPDGLILITNCRMPAKSFGLSPAVLAYKLHALPISQGFGSQDPMTPAK